MSQTLAAHTYFNQRKEKIITRHNSFVIYYTAIPFPRFKLSANLFVRLINKEKNSFDVPIFPSLMSVTARLIQCDGSQQTDERASFR